MGVFSKALVVVCLFAGSSAAQSFPDGLGKETFVNVCSSCHDPTHVLGKQMSKPEWKAKVTEMLQEETDVTDEEKDAIVEYLAKNFPKPEKVNVNKASAKEIALVLEMAPKDGDAIVAYREKNGAFKSFDDLKKVPTVDAGKIEARKGRIEF